MGDAANGITCWVMHSKAYFDLMSQAIADKIFEVSGVTIYEGSVATFNRPTIVVDSPALFTAGTPDTYSVLGLVENAIEVAESEERSIISDVVTGFENLILRIQGEYAFNLRLKGFAWDTVGGGVNPTDTAHCDHGQLAEGGKRRQGAAGRAPDGSVGAATRPGGPVCRAAPSFFHHSC